MERRLIAEVKKHKVIYAQNSEPEYKRRRPEAWRAISQALGVPESVCQARWRSLRDHYVREHKKKQQAAETGVDLNETVWEFYTAMQFLGKHLRPRNSTFQLLDADENTDNNSNTIEAQLIAEVRKYKAIYCKTSNEYRSRRKRAEAWKLISQNLGVKRSACKARWRSLRDRYVREYNKCHNAVLSGSEISEPAWEFYASMEFLRDYVAPRNNILHLLDIDETQRLEIVNIEEQLIEEVQKHKIIYAKNCEAYKNRRKRAEAWKMISEALGIPESACQARWRSLRDHFLREFEKRQNACESSNDESEPAWEFYTPMLFLCDYMGDSRISSKHPPEYAINSDDSMEGVISEFVNVDDLNYVDDSEFPLQSSSPMPCDEPVETNKLKRNERSYDSEFEEVITKIPKSNENSCSAASRPPSSPHPAAPTLSEEAIEEAADDHEHFFGMVRNQFKKLPPEAIDDCKMFILNYLHKEVKSYKRLTENYDSYTIAIEPY